MQSSEELGFQKEFSAPTWRPGIESQGWPGLCLVTPLLCSPWAYSTTDLMSSIYDVEVTPIGGAPSTLQPYQGKVLLIVNTASECGFTPQFAGLQSLYDKYNAKGFTVLGFPCNQFGGQDPGSNEEIQSFCQKNYGVSFPMHEKVDVNGGSTHPLFAHLKAAAPGIVGTESIKWNFTKFLIAPDGSVVARYAPKTAPDELETAIEKLLPG